MRARARQVYDAKAAKGRAERVSGGFPATKSEEVFGMSSTIVDAFNARKTEVEFKRRHEQSLARRALLIEPHSKFRLYWDGISCVLIAFIALVLGIIAYLLWRISSAEEADAAAQGGGPVAALADLFRRLRATSWSPAPPPEGDAYEYARQEYEKYEPVKDEP